MLAVIHTLGPFKRPRQAWQPTTQVHTCPSVAPRQGGHEPNLSCPRALRHQAALLDAGLMVAAEAPGSAARQAKIIMRVWPCTLLLCMLGLPVSCTAWLHTLARNTLSYLATSSCVSPSGVRVVSIFSMSMYIGAQYLRSHQCYHAE